MAKTAKDVKKQIPVSINNNNIEDLPDHDAKVAEIAYRKAENRGFKPGHELDDWLEAEEELNLSGANEDS
ncbi:MAG: DUF2934 domain-containing protein [Methylococcaceae bacterium]